VFWDVVLKPVHPDLFRWSWSGLGA